MPERGRTHSESRPFKSSSAAMFNEFRILQLSLRTDQATTGEKWSRDRVSNCDSIRGLRRAPRPRPSPAPPSPGHHHSSGQDRHECSPRPRTPRLRYSRRDGTPSREARPGPDPGRSVLEKRHLHCGISSTLTGQNHDVSTSSVDPPTEGRELDRAEPVTCVVKHHQIPAWDEHLQAGPGSDSSARLVRDSRIRGAGKRH